MHLPYTERERINDLLGSGGCVGDVAKQGRQPGMALLLLLNISLKEQLDESEKGLHLLPLSYLSSIHEEK